MNNKEFFQRAEYTRCRDEKVQLSYIGIGFVSFLSGMAFGGAIGHFFLHTPFHWNGPPNGTNTGIMLLGGVLCLIVGIFSVRWCFRNQKPQPLPCPSCQKDLSNPLCSPTVKISGCCPACGIKVLKELDEESISTMKLAEFCRRAEVEIRAMQKNMILRLGIFFASWLISAGLAFAISRFIQQPFPPDVLLAVLLGGGFCFAIVVAVFAHYLILRKIPKTPILCPSCQTDLVFPKGSILDTRARDAVIVSKRCSCCGTRVISD